MLNKWMAHWYRYTVELGIVMLVFHFTFIFVLDYSLELHENLIIM